MPAQQPDFPIRPDPEYNYHDKQTSRQERKKIPTVTTPENPPELTPAAARALLRILLSAYQRLPHPRSEET